MTLDDTLRALERNAEEAKSIRVELDETYLRHIAEVEALPENQPGADKSAVFRSLEAARRHFARAKLVR